MSTFILTYYQKHKLLIEENLEGCKNPEDIEAIHNLRLSIKRIRVVAKLADLLSNNAFNSKDSLREINKFFKSSGLLRDMQVTKKLLMEFQNKNLAPIIDRLSKRETKQRSKFEKALLAFPIDALTVFEQRLAETLDGISDKQAMIAGSKLLSDYVTEIHEIFHRSAKEKRMHNIRTRLKDIQYLNNIFDGRLIITGYIIISIERLREVGELAGSWHDHLNLESKLEKYLRKNPRAENTDSLQELIQAIRVKKQGLYQEYQCVLMNEIRV